MSPTSITPNNRKPPKMTERQPAGPPELALVPPHADVLNQIALRVFPGEIETPAFQALVDAMLDFAMGEQGDAGRPTLVGLAAPQLGIARRIIIVGVDAKGQGEVPDLRAYINPEITSVSKQTGLDREGCYSTGNICGIVERPTVVKLRALDRFGVPLQEEHKGFPARIIHHEIDHLDGIRFPDRITDDERLHTVRPEEYGRYRQHWRDWPRLASREEWQTLKRGT
jgi:peptide deformylase